MTDNQVTTLRHIREKYGDIIEIEAARWKHRPEVLAGIMMRETEGGLSRCLDKPGPAGRGDGGHGHGLMQIDDRSFPEFCKNDDWMLPEKNIYMGAAVLAGKRAYLKNKLLGYGLTDDDIERASIAAYNCGEGRVRQAVMAGLPVDQYTAHGDYSRCVLEFADAYLELKAV